ncbi:hypothetical protein [Roseibium sp.]|uniref:hypothetical protein n=1 Tax=Roseibium sp. TaxID=1936156 RepID=UPI003BABEA8D
MKTISILLAFFFLSLSGKLVSAAEMSLTIYDDGRSCPGNCDAHVVFHKSHNGTVNAFAPGSSADNPEKCTNGQTCMICFGEEPSSCMKATFRGSGPPEGKFDFTPAFFREQCDQAGLPSALDNYCKGLRRKVADKGYDMRLNCFDKSDHNKCVSVMADAKKKYEADLPIWEACMREGQRAFNARQEDDTTRRKYDCAYSELKLGGPNSSGVRWHLLQPAACRPGTYVGRDGLDCCDGNSFTAAALHPECSVFHPRP